MPRPLRIPHAEIATIDELKQVSPVGSSETAKRCSAMQMLESISPLRFRIKNEEKLLERLDQAIWDVIDNSPMTIQTTAIGTLF